MGYKLAGYHHLGGVEIDPKIAEIYRTNHHPEHLFVEDLRLFNERTDLPKELYSLDLLDGSPPCSTFSMAGSREKAWGKEKQFAEGQAMQTLDDLVFIYCETIAKLMPKVFLLENVKGLTAGNAKSYLKRIVTKLREVGYDVQVFVLNAASMGVPQKRERTFVIGHRSEFVLPKLQLNFNEKPILFREVIDKSDTSCNLTDFERGMWEKRNPNDRSLGDISMHVRGKNTGFSQRFALSDDVCCTLTTMKTHVFDFPRYMNEREVKICGTFPIDYQYPSYERIVWLCGMSVPPVMTAQIANQIYLQWLKPIKEKEKGEEYA